MESELEKPTDNTRFIRWQAILRDHITFSNNLLLTISIAIIGFNVDLLSGSFQPVGWIKFFFTGGILTHFASVLTGIVTVLSRLSDFRGTTRKIRKVEEVDTDWYGRLTWIMLYSQFLFFGVGILFLGIAISWFYCAKLF